MPLLGFSLAALIGLTLGLLGAGGSILTVPVFVYGLGFDAKQAIAMTLPVVGTTSLVGALAHWRAGNVHVRAAAVFGTVAMVGAFFGARLAAYFSAVVQLTLLAAVMLAAAIAMLRSAGPRAQSKDSDPGARVVHGRLRFAVVVPVGVSIGILTGVVGIGGGFLIVPALVLLADVPVSQAVGTSLLVIAMNSASGLLGYVSRVPIPWGFVALFTAVAVAGILVGTRLAGVVRPTALKRAFAVLLLAMASLILYQNREIFSARGASKDVMATNATPGASARAAIREHRP